MPTHHNPPATLVSLPGTLTVSRENLGETGDRKERKGTKKTKPEEKGKNRKGEINNNKKDTTRTITRTLPEPLKGGGKLKAENDQVHQDGHSWSDDEARETRKSHSI